MRFIHRIYKPRIEINFNHSHPFYQCYIKLRVQLLGKQNLLLKLIKLSKMSTELRLSDADLFDCKRKLFTESVVQRGQTAEQHSNLYKSTIYKGGTYTPVKETPAKRIKLKRHMRTEMPTTPERTSQHRLKTSPNKRSPENLKTPLQDKNLNLPTHQRRNKTFFSEFHTINEVSPLQGKHITTMFSELMPSPTKQSLPYNKMLKSNVSRSASKSEGKQLSKSKKKIHFTIYESKIKATKPQEASYKKSPKKDYNVPYRYNSTITINLFESNTSVTKSKQKNSRSKSQLKSKSRDGRSVSTHKKTQLTHYLIKSRVDQQNDQRVNRTLEKLQKYRFVEEYIQKWQILQKIKLYINSNEPQCKWPLLIVDQIFKKIRSENNFEAYVSK